MTIEERVDSICKWNNSGLRNLVIEEMRAIIEDCAKIADGLKEERMQMLDDCTTAEQRLLMHSQATGAYTCAQRIRARSNAPSNSQMEVTK